MTEPSVRLEPVRVPVEPGGQARVTVTVGNPSPIVQGYRLEVLGEPSAWAEVTPAEVSVYPQQEAPATLVFSPPQGPAVAGGEVPFGVRVVSTVDSTSVVEEGDLEVGRVLGLRPTMVPVTSTGRWSGRHVVRIVNWGNAAVRLRVTATDPDERLGFLVHPSVVDVPLGGEAAVGVRVRARHPFLRGTPLRLPFQVRAEPDPPAPAPPAAYPGADPARPVLDGTFAQKPVLSRGAALVGVGAVVAAVGAGLLLQGASADEPLPQGTPGAPAAPTGLTASATDPETVALTWEPTTGLEGYRLQRVEPGSLESAIPRVLDAQDVPPDLAAREWGELAPDQEHCFQLVAIRDGVGSLPSEADCATTPPLAEDPTTTPEPTSTPGPGGEGPGGNGQGGEGPGGEGPSASPTPSPGGEGTGSGGQGPADPLPPDGWIAARFVFPTPGEDAATTAREQAAELAERQPPAGWLRVEDYSALQEAFPNAEYIVYAGPFPGQSAARQACLTVLEHSAAECALRVQQVGPVAAGRR